MSRDALVVGINRYTDVSLPDLTAPSVDAEAIAQILERDGDFRVTRLPGVKDKENQAVRVGKKTRVPLADLEDAIVQLFKPEGKPPDTALLYFSGHGLRKNRGISEGYLASSDANPDGGNWGLSLQWLRRLLQESDVRQQIIILDCCHAGEVLNVAEADPGDRGNGRDRCFIAASRAFEVAYEAIGSSHSVLTAALLQGLEPQADRWVTNYTLIESLDRFSHNFPQRPIFANSGEPINLTRRWQGAEISQPASATAICPYKGLEYFDCTEADARFFYGRTALTDQLLEKVRSGNFLAVLGASGSGKSSVVRAGLLYQLMLGERLSGSKTWHIRIFTPGKHPLHSLAEALGNSSPNLTQSTEENELKFANHRKAIDDCVGQPNCSGRRLGLEALYQAGRPLRPINLAGANLERIDLSNADLWDVNLQEANLTEAMLVETNFGDANLQGADLSRTFLIKANFQIANLRGAIFRQAVLQDADFQYADLPEADLSRAGLSRANLLGTDLKGAILEDSYLAEADLREADLREANLRGAYLGTANLREANLKGADFTTPEDFGVVIKLFTPAQIKSTCFWEEAKFDPEFQAELNQSPNDTEVDCSRWDPNQRRLGDTYRGRWNYGGDK